tara:strand:- start:181663 stop:181881 length:219 start_codon:yes stop_codon:yes gene_type:complete
MMGLIDSLPDWLILILTIFMFVWFVLMIFLPFFVYGAWFRAKECSNKLTETNEFLEQLNDSVSSEIGKDLQE